MDEKLEAWIAECVGKGTFENREDAIEFCVGATRAFCEKMGINQENLKKEQARVRAKGKKDYIYINFPLKWSDEFDKSLREEDTGGAVHDAVSGAVRDQAWGMLGDPGFAFDPKKRPGDDIEALWADYLVARRYIEKLQNFNRKLMGEKSEVLQQRDELVFMLKGKDERMIWMVSHSPHCMKYRDVVTIFYDQIRPSPAEGWLLQQRGGIADRTVAILDPEKVLIVRPDGTTAEWPEKEK